MPKPLSFEQALNKIASFCAYQERAKAEVIQKLKTYRISDFEIEKIIERLEDENFLDEERFAKTYVRSKFQYKKWGKIKIEYNLRQKQISSKMIEKALTEIQEEDYENLIHDLVEQKRNSLPDLEPFKQKQKIMTYMVSKGFEQALILKYLP